MLLDYTTLIYHAIIFFSETPLDVRSGDTVFAVYSYVAETDEAINLVEGERLYILGKYKTDNIRCKVDYSSD